MFEIFGGPTRSTCVPAFLCQPQPEESGCFSPNMISNNDSEKWWESDGIGIAHGKYACVQYKPWPPTPAGPADMLRNMLQFTPFFFGTSVISLILKLGLEKTQWKTFSGSQIICQIPACFNFWMPVTACLSFYESSWEALWPQMKPGR